MRLPLKFIKNNAVCAEVGVWRGDFSKQILSKKPSELHLIDPWIHQEHEWVEWAKGKRVADAYNHVKNIFSKEDCVSIHRKNSNDMNFGSNYFDWVYIDADHSYDSVVQDLNHWFPQVKKGGFLCGDDYLWGHKLTEGPKRAVDEFSKSKNLKLTISENQYILEI